MVGELLIVGNRGGSNVGGSFERAAADLELAVSLIELCRAMDGPSWLRRFKWHVLGRRPTRLAEFGNDVASYCEEFRPKILLATGQAALGAATLKNIRRHGTFCANYLTDDPWNPVHRARWFLGALPHYDCVFTTRRANIDELRQICRHVKFLPFGYDPELFYPEPLTPDEMNTLASDVLFAGGADRDRAAVIGTLIANGFHVRLYGTYWDRYPETRGASSGQADISLLRKAITATRVALCLVRRANRDEHSMRSFEIPAVGACMLVEKTAEHLEMFGPDGTTVRYFKTTSEMVRVLAELLQDERERHRLSAAVHRRIVSGPNRYRDRLVQMLSSVPEERQCLV
jgi:hypothetical protein